MGLIADLGHGSIAVDTALFIYFIEEHPRFLPVIVPLFRQADQGKRDLITSALTLLEVLVVLYRAGNRPLAECYEALLTRSRVNSTSKMGITASTESTKSYCASLMTLLGATLSACFPTNSNSQKVPTSHFKTIQTYPHDTESFTQGDLIRTRENQDRSRISTAIDGNLTVEVCIKLVVIRKILVSVVRRELEEGQDRFVYMAIVPWMHPDELPTMPTPRAVAS